MPARDLDRFGRQGRQLDLLGLERALPRVLEQLRDEPLEPLRLPHDQVQEPRVLSLDVELLLKHLDRAGDRVETVPDLVRDAGRELPDRRQGLPAADAILEGLHLREILEERDHSAPLPGCAQEKARRDSQRHRSAVRGQHRHLVSSPFRAPLQRFTEPCRERFEPRPERLQIVASLHRLGRHRQDLGCRPVPVPHRAACVDRREPAREVLENRLRIEQCPVQLGPRLVQRQPALAERPPDRAADRPHDEEERQIQDQTEPERRLAQPLGQPVRHRRHHPADLGHVERSVRQPGRGREEEPAPHGQKDPAHQRRQQEERRELAGRPPGEEEEIRDHRDVDQELRREKGVHLRPALRRVVVRHGQPRRERHQEHERVMPSQAQAGVRERDGHRGHQRDERHAAENDRLHRLAKPRFPIRLRCRAGSGLRATSARRRRH